MSSSLSNTRILNQTSFDCIVNEQKNLIGSPSKNPEPHCCMTRLKNVVLPTSSTVVTISNNSVEPESGATMLKVLLTTVDNVGSTTFIFNNIATS